MLPRKYDLLHVLARPRNLDLIDFNCHYIHTYTYLALKCIFCCESNFWVLNVKRTLATRIRGLIEIFAAQSSYFRIVRCLDTVYISLAHFIRVFFLLFSTSYLSTTSAYDKHTHGVSVSVFWLQMNLLVFCFGSYFYALFLKLDSSLFYMTPFCFLPSSIILLSIRLIVTNVGSYKINYSWTRLLQVSSLQICTTFVCRLKLHFVHIWYVL